MNRGHITNTHRYPFDGRQFVLCVCPLGFAHPPADIIHVTDDEDEGRSWWLRLTQSQMTEPPRMG